MEDLDPEVLLASLRRVLKSGATSETKAWVMAAATKITSRAPRPKTAEALALEFTASLDTGLRQSAFELKHLWEEPELMKALFPVDASCEDIVVSGRWPFLPLRGSVESILQTRVLGWNLRTGQEAALSPTWAPWALFVLPAFPPPSLEDKHRRIAHPGSFLGPVLF